MGRAKAGKNPELAARRLRALIEFAGERRNHSPGWKTELADEWGIHRSYLSKVISGDRTRVGASVIERVAKGMGIRQTYFTDESTVDPSPADYLPRLSFPVPNEWQADWLFGRSAEFLNMMSMYAPIEYSGHKEARSPETGRTELAHEFARLLKDAPPQQIADRILELTGTPAVRMAADLAAMLRPVAWYLGHSDEGRAITAQAEELMAKIDKEHDDA